MAKPILDYSPVEINGNFSTNHDQAMFLLAKLNALLELGLNCEPEILARTILHSYLCVLSELVEQLEAVIA